MHRWSAEVNRAPYFYRTSPPLHEMVNLSFNIVCHNTSNHKTTTTWGGNVILFHYLRKRGTQNSYLIYFVYSKPNPLCIIITYHFKACTHTHTHTHTYIYIYISLKKHLPEDGNNRRPKYVGGLRHLWCINSHICPSWFFSHDESSLHGHELLKITCLYPLK